MVVPLPHQRLRLDPAPAGRTLISGPDGDGRGERLVTVADPPPVQMEEHTADVFSLAFSGASFKFPFLGGNSRGLRHRRWFLTGGFDSFHPA